MPAEFGVTLDLAPFRGRIDPDYNASFILDAIKDCSALLRLPTCQILEESRNRVGVVRIPLDREKEVALVIKEFRTQGVDRLKSGFQSSKAHRAWTGSRALIEAGLRTPRPVAYIEKKGVLFLQQSFFLSEYLPGLREIRFLFRELSPDAVAGLIQELAVYLGRCRRAGILHRDLSDGNILVKKVADERHLFFLLDTNRIRVMKKIGVLRGIKSVIRLGLPRHFRRSFLAGFLEKSSVGRGLWLWYRINKAAYTGLVNFRKALRLKKIAQKLKVQ